LLEVARIENGQTPRGLAEALLPGPSTESVPFYKVGDMNAGDGQAMSTARFHVSRSAAERLGLHLRRPGCVLIPKRGGAINTNKKRLLNTEAAFDLNTMGLRPTDAVRQQYLWHWLDGIDLGAIADGSNVPQINAPQIRRLSLPVPSLDVQDRTCDELDIFMSQRLAAGEEVRRSRERAVTLRAALLRSAFSGRLTGRSSGLDRAEEMASA
jgi:type I restriction enzyme S subunit